MKATEPSNTWVADPRDIVDTNCDLTWRPTPAPGLEHGTIPSECINSQQRHVYFQNVQKSRNIFRDFWFTVLLNIILLYTIYIMNSLHEFSLLLCWNVLKSGLWPGSSAMISPQWSNWVNYVFFFKDFRWNSRWMFFGRWINNEIDWVLQIDQFGRNHVSGRLSWPLNVRSAMGRCPEKIWTQGRGTRVSAR